MIKRTTGSGGPFEGDDLALLGDQPPREAWIGRLRYVVVPILAVLAIAAAIYVLEGGNGGLGGAEDVARASGANAVNVPVTGDAAKIPAPRVGYAAPDFTLMSLDGKQTKLSDYRGQTVFLNFFATWCPPCRAEMPDIIATYEAHKDQGVVVLAVDLQEESTVVAGYASNVGLPFPIVLDRSGYVSAMYRINAIPTSFFIDKEGVIRDMQIGPMPKDLMLKRLQKAL